MSVYSSLLSPVGQLLPLAARASPKAPVTPAQFLTVVVQAMRKGKLAMAEAYAPPATPIPSKCDQCGVACTSECMCGELLLPGLSQGCLGGGSPRKGA